MSINTVVNTGTRNGKRDVPTVFSLPQAEPVTSYVRPADWLTMPTVLSSDQKIVLLVGVENVSSNFFAVTCTTSAGTYTINWGDGTPDTVTASGSSAYHNFDWNNLSSGTLTTRGYRQAIVTITPTSANLLTCLFAPAYVGAIGTVTAPFNNKILESIVAGSNLTSVQFNGAGQNSMWMEQSTVLSLSSTASLSSMYNTCRSLQNIVSFPDGNYTNLNSMFTLCSSLQVAPLFQFATSGVTMNNTFNGCNSLVTVPLYNTIGVTSMIGTFLGCFILNNIPFFNTQNVTTMSTMFRNCYALTSVPPFDTRNVTVMNQMFINCYALKSCPTFNTGAVTNATEMFSTCYSLVEAPPLNLASVLTADSMFTNCFSLTTVPAYNLSSATTIAAMFTNCYNLVSVGTLTTGNSLTTMSQAFTQCRSLLQGPTITNTSRVTIMTELFYACYSLQSVPVYDTANVTTLNGMFGFTNILKTAPAINTIKSNNLTGLFQGSGIINGPAYDSSNVITMATTFYQCNNLQTVASYDTRKVTNMNATFQATPALVEIPYMNTVNVTNFLNFALQSNVRRVNSSFNTSNATNINGIFATNSALTTIPTLDCTNVTTSGTAFSGMPALNSISVSNLKISTSVANDNLGKPELETLMLGLGTNATSQTLTISSNPGADNPVSKTSLNYSSGSNTVVVANTVGLVTGMILGPIANINSNIAATFTNANSCVTLPMRLDDNTLVSFSSVTTSNVAANTLYYVQYNNGSAPSIGYRLATTPGGANILLTSGTGVARISASITQVNTNANIVLNYLVSNSVTATTTFRQLNTNYATFKNWTISG